MKRIIGIFLAIFLGVSCIAGAAEEKPKILIATGGIGGIYYFYGTAVAEIITKYAGVEATAVQTAAAIDNMQLVQNRTDPKKNTYYLGLALPDSIQTAYTGEHEKFKSKPAKDMRIMWAMYPSSIHIIAAPGSGIKSVSDLKGKRVGTGAPGSGAEFHALMVLETAGVKISDLAKQERLGASESGEALSHGTLDAYFWTGGVPTGSVTELANSISRKGAKLEFVNMDPKGDLIKKLLKKFPGTFEVSVIPKEVYGTATDGQTISFWNIFIGPKSLPEKYSYAITKALFEHQDELQKAVKAAKDNTLANALKLIKGKVPYDPGSLKYYKEKGIIK